MLSGFCQAGAASGSLRSGIAQGNPQHNGIHFFSKGTSSFWRADAGKGSQAQTGK
jgi:hypothetical protein